MGSPSKPKTPRRTPLLPILVPIGAGIAFVHAIITASLPVFFLFVGVFFLVVPVALRSAVLAQLDGNLRFPPAQADDFPLLDEETVNRNVAELEALGFRHQRDFCVEASSPLVSPGFARSFFHPELNCLAEVNQMFPKNTKPMPVICVIISYFGTGNLDSSANAVAPPPLPDPSGELPPLPPLQGYMYSTHNRKRSWLMNMIRHDRSFGTSLPEAGPQELLRVHLERCDQISQALGEPPDSGDLDRTYFAFSSQIRRDLHRRLARRDPWTLVYGALFKGKEKSEWLGDLAIEP